MIYKVLRSDKEMHGVCVDYSLVEEDILRWISEFFSSDRNAWHDLCCVESGY